MSDGKPLERLGHRGGFKNVLLMPSRVLSALAHALAIVAAIHYVWLILCSLSYQRVTLNKIQPKILGGITDAKYWLALAAGAAIEERDSGNDSTVSVLVVGEQQVSMYPPLPSFEEPGDSKVYDYAPERHLFT